MSDQKDQILETLLLRAREFPTINILALLATALVWVVTGVSGLLGYPLTTLHAVAGTWFALAFLFYAIWQLLLSLTAFVVWLVLASGVDHVNLIKTLRGAKHGVISEKTSWKPTNKPSSKLN